MAVATTKDGRHFAYWRVRGKMVRKYFGHGDAARLQAIRFDNERKSEKAARRTAGPLFSDLSRVYLEEKPFSENSRQMLAYRMRAYVPHFGHRKAMAISNRDLAAYVAGRRAGSIGRRGKVKDNTIRREINDIKAIYAYCARHRQPPLIPYSPVKDFAAPVPDDARIIPPSAAEGRRIYNAAPDHLRRFILLCWYLGLRPGRVEVLERLTWGKVSWETRRIRVTSAKKGGPVDRDVPIHREFQPTLAGWYEKDRRNLAALVEKAARRKTGRKRGTLAPVPHDVRNLTIVHYWGHPIRYSIRTAWKSALRTAGITRRLRPYDLRHHFATRALESGGDLKSLSLVMGSSPKTLIHHYQHVTDALANATVNLIPPLDPKATPKEAEIEENARKSKKVIDIRSRRLRS